jgi:hypothetical protein
MLAISQVVKTDAGEWDEMWQMCESATYYHSREWAEIWESYTNGSIRPYAMTITFSDNIKVILPVMRRNYYGGIISRYAITGPPFISKYGNWLHKDRLSNNHIELLSRFIINRFKNLTWQLNPFDCNSKDIAVNSVYTKRYPEITYSINLSKGEEAIFGKFKTSCKNHIKQGINNNLIVSEETSLKHWKQYYEIYLDTVKRWGKKVPYVLSWKLFEILFNKKSPYIKLWLVWLGSTPVAGCVNFYSNRKIMAWHMTSVTEYRNLRPVHLLEYSMILDGICNNYSWYDMGTDAGIKGLADFKRSFGPEKLMADKIVSWQSAIFNFCV